MQAPPGEEQSFTKSAFYVAPIPTFDEQRQVKGRGGQQQLESLDNAGFQYTVRNIHTVPCLLG